MYMEQFLWMYKATICNPDEHYREEPRAGVIVANSMKDAFQQLYDHYGDELKSVAIEDVDSYADPIKIDPASYDLVKKLLTEVE